MSYVAIIVGTVLFMIIYGVTAYFVTDHVMKQAEDEKTRIEYRNMSIGLTFLGVFCMWLMWLCVYMHQMNPLIYPILDKEVVEKLHGQ